MSFSVGGRDTIVVDEGPYTGAEIEVNAIAAWPVYYLALGLTQAFVAAKSPSAEYKALRDLYSFVETAARPTWNLVDGSGPIPPTAAGMLRVPVPLMTLLVDLWTEQFRAANETPEPEG